MIPEEANKIKTTQRKARIMKISVNTVLGEFKFNYSQATVIYLLGLMQKLEDEGDESIDINDKVYNINKIIDKGDELKFPPEEEPETDNATIREDEKPEEDKQEEQPEDFGTLLEEYEKKNKREWNSTGQAAGPAGGKYKGFLLIKCEHCGETRGFCAKQPIDEYKCNSCGEKTKLKDLRRLFMDCECGRHSKYYTNETAEVVTHNCIECGSPVDMMLNSRRTAYVSIGGGTARKRNSDKRISTQKFRW